MLLLNISFCQQKTKKNDAKQRSDESDEDEDSDENANRYDTRLIKIIENHLQMIRHSFCQKG